MLAGGFPLFANPMFVNLGFPGASSLLGGIVSGPMESLRGGFIH